RGLPADSGAEVKAGAGAELSGPVRRVGQGAGPQGKAAAADTRGEIVAQFAEEPDAVVHALLPAPGQPGPVRPRGGPPGRQARQRLGNLRQVQAHSLRGADEGDAPQYVTAVAALAARGPVGGYQASRLVEP